jgi:DNA uptake protein ComE-like DNA-binding protein
MIIHEKTIMPVVSNWARDRKPSWALADINAICTAIAKISGGVTAHIVKDVALIDEEIQQILLARALGTLDDWLVRTATGLRQSLNFAPPVRNLSGEVALGLRSATTPELVDLPGIDSKRAFDIVRFLALHPNVTSIDDLAAVDGLGVSTVNKLKENTYLNQPRANLVSAYLLSFCLHPTITNYLDLLDRTELEMVFGDRNTLTRHSPLGGTTVERLLRFLKIVQIDAENRLSPASGMLASQGKRHLARHLLRQRYMDRMNLVNAEILVNNAYVGAMLDLISSAKNTLKLAAFVATVAPGEHPGEGPQIILEALATQAAAGVNVQVILDRDEPGQPYHSSAINRQTIEWMRAARIAVKQDEPATLFHSKFLVADQSRVIVGSHNLTQASISKTYELSVRLDGMPLANEFAHRFDVLWSTLP